MLQPKKIERTCPRCHRHAYHWLSYKENGKAVADCVNCGHQWSVRVMEKDK